MDRKSLGKLLKHPLTILLLGAVLTYGVGEGIRDSYQERQSKGNFSLRVVQLAWNQLFWMRVYVTRTTLGLPPEDLDYAWNKYITSLESWNTDLMGNIQLFDRYYPGKGKRAEFEGVIQPGFKELNDLLIDLRYSKNPPDSTTITAKIDSFNVTLYQFASGLNVEFSR